MATGKSKYKKVLLKEPMSIPLIIFILLQFKSCFSLSHARQCLVNEENRWIIPTEQKETWESRRQKIGRKKERKSLHFKEKEKKGQSIIAPQATSLFLSCDKATTLPQDKYKKKTSLLCLVTKKEKMNSSRLEFICKSPETVLMFYQDNRLLATEERRCTKCHQTCILRQWNVTNGFSGMCSNCQCRHWTFLCHGTFFQRSYLRLPIINKINIFLGIRNSYTQKPIATGRKYYP